MDSNTNNSSSNLNLNLELIQIDQTSFSAPSKPASENITSIDLNNDNDLNLSLDSILMMKRNN